jgi:hypothetical protein
LTSLPESKKRMNIEKSNIHAAFHLFNFDPTTIPDTPERLKVRNRWAEHRGVVRDPAKEASVICKTCFGVFRKLAALHIPYVHYTLVNWPCFFRETGIYRLALEYIVVRFCSVILNCNIVLISRNFSFFKSKRKCQRLRELWYATTQNILVRFHFLRSSAWQVADEVQYRINAYLFWNGAGVLGRDVFQLASRDFQTWHSDDHLQAPDAAKVLILPHAVICKERKVISTKIFLAFSFHPKGQRRIILIRERILYLQETSTGRILMIEHTPSDFSIHPTEGISFSRARWTCNSVMTASPNCVKSCVTSSMRFK